MIPPRRFVIEHETNEQGIEECKLVEVTGEQELLGFLDDEGNCWAGIPIEEVLKYAEAGAYVDDIQSAKIAREARKIIAGESA